MASMRLLPYFLQSASLESRAIQSRPRSYYPTLALVLISLAALIVPIAANPEFVDTPFDPSTSGNIYLPPNPGAGDLRLVCSTSKPASFTWIAVVDGTTYRPGLTPLNITQVNNKTSVLYVRNDGFQARGILLSKRRFQCRAKDDGDMTENSTRTFTFVAGDYPAFSTQPGNVQVKEGEDTELSCAVNEALQPAPSVLWMFQNNTGNFTLNPTRDNEVLKQKTYYLKIDGYLHEDGTYWCTATNQFGVRSSQSSRVIVTYFETDFNFTISPSKVKEGDQVTFFVEIVSSPLSSSINIRKVNEKNALASAMSSNKLLSKMKATRNLTGDYNATAIHQSIRYTKTANLTVLSTPGEVSFSVIDRFNTSFIYMWNVGLIGNSLIINITVCCTDQERHIRNVTCAEGISKTTSLVSVSGVTSDTLDTLIPNTKYFCQLFATNALGSTGSDTTPVSTLTLPSMPIVTCVDSGESFITLGLSVSFNGGDEILDYDVTYYSVCSNTSQSQAMKESKRSEEPSLNVTGLTKNCQYHFQVRARNRIGRSPPASKVCNTTCILGPLSEKDHHRNHETEAMLILNQPDSKCGSVIRYEVRLCGKTSLLETTLIQLATEVRINVTGLQSSDGCLAVTAITANGFETTTFQVPVEKATSSGVSTAAIAAPCVIIGFLLILAAVLLGVYKYRQNKEAQMDLTYFRAEKRTEDRYQEHPRAVAESASSQEAAHASAAPFQPSEQQEAPQPTNAQGGPDYAELQHNRPEERPMPRFPPTTVLYSTPEFDEERRKQILAAKEAEERAKAAKEAEERADEDEESD